MAKKKIEKGPPKYDFGNNEAPQIGAKQKPTTPRKKAAAKPRKKAAPKKAAAKPKETASPQAPAVETAGRKKSGAKRRIPENYEKKIFRIDPVLKDRLLTVVLTAKIQKNDAYDLQDIVMNDALNEYLNKVEKKLKIK